KTEERYDSYFNSAGSVECLEPRFISFNYGKVPQRLAIVLVEHRVRKHEVNSRVGKSTALAVILTEVQQA
ncbi:unnamed protein product, partial [Heterotrigona itama]